MTYRQLLEALKELSEDELENSITVYIEPQKAAYKVDYTAIVKKDSSLSGIVDLDVPILVIV
jgi:hypothetical protein